jgi:hypothetical protein
MNLIAEKIKRNNAFETTALAARSNRRLYPQPAEVSNSVQIRPRSAEKSPMPQQAPSCAGRSQFARAIKRQRKKKCCFVRVQK